nr:MAG TPA: hypothetical protein [Caudoviricetes sp.]
MHIDIYCFAPAGVASPKGLFLFSVSNHFLLTLYFFHISPII